jgi:hypothetical protein
MPSIKLSSRGLNDTSTSSQVYTIDIVGFCLVGAVFLVIILVCIRLLRKRALSKRDDARGAAFLSVRGLVREGEKVSVNEPLPERLPSIRGTFSREQINSGIVLPDKTHTPRASDARSETIRYHRESGNYPRPFSFALSASSPRPSFDRPSILPPHQSFQSASSKRSSVLSSAFSTTSSASSQNNGHTRKVHQLFSPLLPDELLLACVGERLTVVQSFDDGWCVVGRKNGIPKGSSNHKSQFKSSSSSNTPESNVELGVVPAWCFLKPVKGLRAERPVRSSSLGVTVRMEGPSSRDEVISWSNF